MYFNHVQSPRKMVAGGKSVFDKKKLKIEMKMSILLKFQRMPTSQYKL